MLAKRTSLSLAPSFEDPTRAQSPAPRWSGYRFSRRAKRVAIHAAARGAHPGGAGRRIAFRQWRQPEGAIRARRRPGILADRVTTWWRNLHPGESRGTSRPEIANHRTVVRGWDGLNRPIPPVGPGATIGPTPAIMSAMGPIGPPASAWARKSMAARPGAGFRPCPAGKSIDGLVVGERDHRGSDARREQTQTPSRLASGTTRAAGGWRVEPQQAGGEAPVNDPPTQLGVGGWEASRATGALDRAVAYSCGTPLNIFDGLPSES